MDWSQVTLVPALLGGVLIGIATAVLILFNGKIAGISGILGGLLTGERSGLRWRACFVVGLLLSPLVYALVAPLPPVTSQSGPSVTIAAGLLVGLGSRFASGCTSGHGVCGIARGALRSVVATMVFMVTGMLTVFFMQHVI